jgi:hypothetical protein|nr:MAG TPA: MotA/TolQ/ExbB proton channel family [Caudoviricetes sp.]
MENIIVTVMNNLEELEKKRGMVGTVIGLILITLVIGIAIFGITTIVKFSISLINVICIEFFRFRLY